MAETFRKDKHRLLFEIVFFGIVAVFLFWRAKYGHYYSDESFLVSLAQRLYKGDALIVDEWHVCQNTGFLLLPFYALYYSIFGSVEGILLFFRNVYCLIFFAALLCMNIKLRSHAPLSYIMLLCTALYAPLDFMTLSYTTLSFVAIMLICCILYKDVLTDWRAPVKTGIALGMLATVTTLSYPYFAFLFVLYYPALAVYAVIGRRKRGEKYSYILRLSFGMTGAIGLCILLYGLLLFSRSGVDAFLMNLPQIFNDPQHPTRGFSESLYDAVYTGMLTGRENIIDGFIYYAAAFLLTGLAFFSKRIKKYRVFVFLPLFVLWIYNTWDIFSFSFLKVNRHMKDFFVLGILAFALLEKKPWKLFISFALPTVFYALVVWFSSNTGIICISMGLAPGTLCAVLLVSMLALELFEQYKGCRWKACSAAAIAALAVFCQLGLELKVRFTYTYQDDAIPNLTESLSYGPEKGIMTTRKNAQEYYAKLDGLNQALSGHDIDGKSFLALNCEPIIYLAADMDYATYSAWMLGDENASQRVRQYYDINEKPSPDFIYDGDGSADISIITEDSYRLEQYGQARLYVKE